MPTDASINLKTSAAAAFCARLCVHPLDHLRASLLGSENATAGGNKNVFEIIYRHLFSHHHDQSATRNQYRRHQTYRERIELWRGLYKGVSFALVIQVPALALFLSTYDATKHGLAHLSSRLHLSRFHLHHFETHLISGMMAKVAGTFLWAPMIKLQTLQGQILGQSLATAGARLSLTRAYGLIKNVGQSPEGYKGLWSGYRPTLTTLLPYTMIYFAIYEQLKQLTRWVILNSKSEENTISIGNGRNEDSWTVPLDTVHENPFPLNLGAYMVCVSGAVALSAAVCHISSALRVQCMEWLTTSTADAARASRSSIAAAGSMTATSKIQGVTSAAAAHIRTISFVTPAPAMPSLPPHYTSTTSSHLSTRLQCQHANLTSIPSRATPKLTPSASTATSASNRKSQHSIQLWKQEQQQPFIRRLRTTASTMAMTMKSSSPSKFLRQITRGLGPRILWTAPGVTLTTAGFEVFRNMALGIV